MTAGPNDTPRGPAAKERSPVSRVAACVIVVGGIALLLRAAPVLDASVKELWGRLNAVHQEALAARERPAEWGAFSERASNDLKQIADDARRAHERRIGPWRWVSGVDRREEAALREVQRLAESDVPALIASGPKGSALREKNVSAALGRLDDHLAGASPYLPPMRPIENQDGMDRTTGVRQAWPRWLVGVVALDVVLVVLGLWWWVRRGRRARSAA